LLFHNSIFPSNFGLDPAEFSAKRDRLSCGKRLGQNVPLRPEMAALQCATMKYLAVLFALSLAVLDAAAQVSVDIKFDQEQFLPNEPLIARVKVRNDSGQTLHLAESDTWITLIVEGTEGAKFVRQRQMPKVREQPFDLESSKVASVNIDLAPCWELNKTGRYKVTATVSVPAFNEKFASPARSFLIGGGSPIWEQAFGVPAEIAPPGPDGKPEVRKYKLIQTNPGADAKLFVRVTDQYDLDLRVIQIGRLVSFSKPEPQLDRWSNLHLLYQTGARAFLYTVINPEGMVIAREKHDQTDTRPTLRYNDEGRISVQGGLRRYTRDDLPPVEPSILSAAAVVDDANATAALSNLPPKKTGKEAAKSKDAQDKKKR
jgi:hypothetical protein